jgi:hypothetical protein
VRDELCPHGVVNCPSDSEVTLFLLISREPRPDFAHWPGRRVLAALDALAWPLAAVAVVAAVPFEAGAFGAVVTVIAAYLGVQRLHRALWMNQRYRFTTWVWGKRLVAILLFGLLLQLALHVT